MTDARPTPLRRATILASLGRDREGPVSPPIRRFSTVCYPTMQALRDAGAERYGKTSSSYGTHGGDTQFRLEEAVSAIEGGTASQVTGNGLAAIVLALVALLSAGDHVLIVDSVYGPSRRLADTVLARFGVAATYYDPSLSPGEVADLFRPETRVVLTESPGSNTFEMQDIPALASIARRNAAHLVLDNTWGFASFNPFAHGVDVSIQALTKYAGGHADLLLGAVTVADDAMWRRIRDTALTLGQGAAPEDCWLALRGLRTLDVRLERQFRSSLLVAAHLRSKAEVARVLHPGLPGAPGHDLWRRDYEGVGASLFGLEFRAPIGVDDVDRFVDRLALFGKGWSWGGFESLANTVTGGIVRDHGVEERGTLCRLHVGLEAPEDLVADLDQAWRAFAR